MEASKLKPCVHGGNKSCEKQGGSGSLKHGSGYVHPHPTLEEVGPTIGEYIEPVSKGSVVTSLDLGDFFDDELAESYLFAEIQNFINTKELVRKSLYDFDLVTVEGIDSLLALLPIMDPIIMKEVVQEIWPGYPVEDNFDPKIQRAEIRGFLLDYLQGHGQEEAN